MSAPDDRAAFEAEELRGLAETHGATREYVPELGIMVWRFPAWQCPHCTEISGPDSLVQAGCPQPLARHGPVQWNRESRFGVNLTAEDRQDRLKRARLAYSASIAAGAHYRRDFLDSPLWDQLASEQGVRLPMWHIAPTSAKMSKWLKCLGFTTQEWLEMDGSVSLKDYARRNPHWPLRAFVGELLEESRDGRAPRPAL